MGSAVSSVFFISKVLPLVVVELKTQKLIQDSFKCIRESLDILVAHNNASGKITPDLNCTDLEDLLSVFFLALFASFHVLTKRVVPFHDLMANKVGIVL